MDLGPGSFGQNQLHSLYVTLTYIDPLFMLYLSPIRSVENEKLLRSDSGYPLTTPGTGPWYIWDKYGNYTTKGLGQAFLPVPEWSWFDSPLPLSRDSVPPGVGGREELAGVGRTDGPGDPICLIHISH